MTRYLSTEPFGVGGGTSKAYEDGWDRIFGANEQPDLRPRVIYKIDPDYGELRVTQIIDGFIYATNDHAVACGPAEQFEFVTGDTSQSPQIVRE